MFRLVVYDRKTHYVLWTVTQSIEAAVGQKAHDKTFDGAIGEILNRLLQVAGKPPAAAHRKNTPTLQINSRFLLAWS
ncbi:MAG: hypothetical protein ABSF23_04790 [Terracidiphilus sp.]|jgi:hypothetical protein